MRKKSTVLHSQKVLRKQKKTDLKPRKKKSRRFWKRRYNEALLWHRNTRIKQWSLTESPF